jgi:predicted Zn-dependent protease
MRRAAVLAFLPLVAACEVAAPPERPAPYEFTIRLSNGFPLVFRWPAASLPVRVWAEPALYLDGYAAEALALWGSGILYAEFSGTMVRDSATADILIRLGEPEPPGPANHACRSWTFINVGLDTAIILPFRTVIAPRVGASSGDLDTCMRWAVAHELGHAFGLFLESDDSGDLMYPVPAPGGLSARDVATLEELYHTAPTVRLPAGR